MPLLALGLNHQTASLPMRERFAISPEQLPACLQQLLDVGISEVVLLSTCNRTEIYCDAAHTDLVLAALCAFCQVPQLQASNIWYIHHEEAALRHLVAVAAGLDSMILGEPQIFGQVKNAYEQAQQAGTVGKVLHQAFQHCFFLTKKIRNETNIGKNPVSVVFAATSLAKHIFASLSDCKVLLLGAGDTIALAARHFQQQGVEQLYFVNRSFHPAQQLAKMFQASAYELSEINFALSQADIILAATNSPQPLITKAMCIKNARRYERPLLLLDLGVPRNIDPTIATLSDCYLYSIDDLHTVVLENIEQRRDAAKIAEEIINHSVTQFFQRQKLNTHAAAIEHFNVTLSTMVEKFSEEIVHTENIDEVKKQAKQFARLIQHQAVKFLQETELCQG